MTLKKSRKQQTAYLWRRLMQHCHTLVTYVFEIADMKKALYSLRFSLKLLPAARQSLTRRNEQAHCTKSEHITHETCTPQGSIKLQMPLLFSHE